MIGQREGWMNSLMYKEQTASYATIYGKRRQFSIGKLIDIILKNFGKSFNIFSVFIWSLLIVMFASGLPVSLLIGDNKPITFQVAQNVFVAQIIFLILILEFIGFIYILFKKDKWRIL